MVEHMDIISVGEAARILRRSEATVRAWTDAGRLAGYRVAATGQRLYLRIDVERLARECEDR